MASLTTAAEFVEKGEALPGGYENKYRGLLARRPDCGLCKILKSYYYFPAVIAAFEVNPPVSMRFIDKLGEPDNHCYGPCYACTLAGRVGKLYSVVFREPIASVLTVMLGCMTCDYVGPLTRQEAGWKADSALPEPVIATKTKGK